MVTVFAPKVKAGPFLATARNSVRKKWGQIAILDPKVAIDPPPRAPGEGARETLWWHLKEAPYQVPLPLLDFTFG